MADLIPSKELLFIIEYGYIVVIPLIVISGSVVSLAVAFLSSVGVFSPVGAFVAIFIGGFIGSVMWYLIGKHGMVQIRKYKKIADFIERINADESRARVVRSLYENHLALMVFLTNISMIPWVFPTNAVLAALYGVKFKKFLFATIIADVVLASLVFSIGYFIGDAVEHPSRILNITGIALVIIIIGILIYKHFLHKLIREKIGDILNINGTNGTNNSEEMLN